MKITRLSTPVLLFLFTINLCFTCQKTGSKDETIWVYKTKNDYSDRVSVELSTDKSEITSFPGPFDVDNKRFAPTELIDGYCLNGIFGGINTGYLSLTIEEYEKYEISPGRDSLYKLLIEKDPFVTFYQRNDHDNVFDDENGAYGIDTAFINDLITKDELDLYFERLK